MALTGQAKTDYQREYMRKRRANTVRPKRAKRERKPTQRFRIFERDNFRCQYCGRTPADDVRLEVDHITPRCAGGTNEDSNLITACFTCNRSKGGEPLNYDAEQSMMDRIEQPDIAKPVKLIRPEGVSDSQWAYIKMRAEK